MSTESKPSENGHAIVLEDVAKISLGGEVFPSTIVSQWRAWASCLVRLNNLLGMSDAKGAYLSSVQICEPREGSGILFVVKGQLKKRAVKGFHRADNVADGINTLLGRITAGSLDWRDDLPYASRMPISDEGVTPLGSPPVS